MRGSRIVKILFGLRGVGKTAALARWRNELLAEGYPEERLVCIDAEEPVLRQLTSADDILRYLETQFPAEGPVTLMIEEPMSFPDAGNLIERPDPSQPVAFVLPPDDQSISPAARS